MRVSFLRLSLKRIDLQRKALVLKARLASYWMLANAAANQPSGTRYPCFRPTGPDRNNTTCIFAVSRSTYDRPF